MTLGHHFGVLAGGGVGHNVIFNFSRFFMGILQAKCLNYEMYDPWVSG